MLVHLKLNPVYSLSIIYKSKVFVAITCRFLMDITEYWRFIVVCFKHLRTHCCVNEKALIFVNCCVDEKAINHLRELQMQPDDFDRIKLIGKGAYGAVQLVSDC